MKINEVIDIFTPCNECPYASDPSLDEDGKRKLSAPTKSQCQVKKLSNVRYAQCVARGLKKHSTKHTDGTGRQGVAGSGKTQNGRYIKSEKFGGPNKYYPGSRS